MYAQKTNNWEDPQDYPDPGNTHTNRRTHQRSNKRLNYKAEVLFSTDSIITKGMTKDLSASGAAIQSLDLPDVGDVLIISIPYAKKQRSVRRRAVVRWVEGKVFGIEFT